MCLEASLLRQQPSTLHILSERGNQALVTNSEGSRSGCLAKWFLEAWATKAKQPHMSKNRMVFWPCRRRWQGQQTTCFWNICGFLAIVPQASKNSWPTNHFGIPLTNRKTSCSGIVGRGPGRILTISFAHTSRASREPQMAAYHGSSGSISQQHRTTQHNQ